MPSQQLDESLTELDWLQNFNFKLQATQDAMAAIAPPTPDMHNPKAPVGSLSANTTTCQVDPYVVLNLTGAATPRIKQEPGVVSIVPSVPHSPQSGDYSRNPHIKPSHSYATLISMAMRESHEKKITLSGIYNWITDHFAYYQRHVNDFSWQNSIRHNLSLNKCFQKVARRKDEPGKGGFWRINPEHGDMFENGILKARRFNSGSVTPPPLKRIKIEKPDCCIATTQSSVRSSYVTLLSTKPDVKLASLIDEVDDQGSSRVVLHQDFNLGGVAFNINDLLDDKFDTVKPWGSAPISPPASDDNSVMSLDDLLNSADLSDKVGDGVVDVSDVLNDPTTRPNWRPEHMDSEANTSFLTTNKTSGDIANDVQFSQTNRTISTSGINSDSMFTFDIDLSRVKKEKFTNEYPCDVPSLTPPPSESSSELSLDDLLQQTTRNDELELAVSSLTANARDMWNDNGPGDASSGLVYSEVNLNAASLDYQLSDRKASSEEPVISFDVDFVSLLEMEHGASSNAESLSVGAW